LNPVSWNPENSFSYQLQQLGLAPEQINQVILTHLHPDHIGGLKDFPQARFILSEECSDLLIHSKTSDLIFENMLPEDMTERVNPISLLKTSPLKGFRGTDLWNDGSIWLIDLPGHAKGQMGIFFPEKNLFYLADALWDMAFINYSLKFIPRRIQYHYPAYKESLEKIKNLMLHQKEIRLFTSHGEEEVFLNG